MNFAAADAVEWRMDGGTRGIAALRVAFSLLLW